MMLKCLPIKRTSTATSTTVKTKIHGRARHGKVIRIDLYAHLEVYVWTLKVIMYAPILTVVFSSQSTVRGCQCAGTSEIPGK